MKHLLSCFLICWSAFVYSANPRVEIHTNMGHFVIELDAEKAPASVDNFLRYANDGFYVGTIFHRVIKDFMVQGGGFTQDFTRKETHPPIVNEANNGLKNQKGTVAMARTNDPNSASSQFFVNANDNEFLDHKAPTPQGWGYAVFGKVVEGMDVIEKIQNVPTGEGGPFKKDVPQEPILIEKVVVHNAPAAAAPKPETQTKPAPAAAATKEPVKPAETAAKEPVKPVETPKVATEAVKPAETQTPPKVAETPKAAVVETPKAEAAKDPMLVDALNKAKKAPDKPSTPDKPEPVSN